MDYLDIFMQLAAIPRPSHHEERVADFLCSFAEERGLPFKRDERNCVAIRKAASPGYESHEVVVLLCHMDMVCVAEPGKRFDPLTDGITPIIYDEGGERWMKADGTSLGADNGIGLAMALAILADDSLPHPALELLATTNEEDGMTGAEGLSPDFISGRKVINLDSEAYDEITVASAGAYLQKMRLPYHRTALPKGYIPFSVSVFGGKGGHSGVDINRGRGNAIKILANLLLVAIRQLNIKLYLITFCGGQSAAAIPAEAEARVAIPADQQEAFATLTRQCDEALAAQFSETDPDIEVICEKAVWRGSIVNEEGTHLLLAALNAIPVGPLELDGDKVLTSNNIGRLSQSTPSTTGGAFTVSIHTRSFDRAALHDLARNISQIFTLTGATAECLMDLTPWREDPDSPFLRLAADTFRATLGIEPRLVSMHFALEAAYLAERFPGIQILSIGPRILFPHSTDERVSLTTADDIWRLTLALLKAM